MVGEKGRRSLKTVQMQGARREDSEAYDCTPQEDARSGTKQMGRFQRPAYLYLRRMPIATP
jgi:hypothetical protein